MTLRCVEWKEKDDPWKEQKKNIASSGSDHPLGVLRDYVPRTNDYEIIRKPMVILKWGLIKFIYDSDCIYN